jgi:hypothetical protein
MNKKSDKKMSKKLSVSAASHWHGLNINQVLGPVTKKDK